MIAGLARLVHDVGIAEDLAQDALVAALEQWPESGIPDNPGAWLMATAKHRAIDMFRRNRRFEQKQPGSSAAKCRCRRWPCPTSIQPWMMTSATICCAWSLSHVTRCFHPMPASRLRFDC